MSQSNKTYTYRCGQKFELEKSPDQMIVRALPEQLNDAAIADAKQVSSASTRIKTSTSELDTLMERSREIAPTHHAYNDSQSGSEFLITDRIFVTFKETLTDEQVDEFANHYGLLNKAAYSDRDFLFQLTNHTGMNPVKLIVKLMENESRVHMAEHDLNQRISRYQFSIPQDPDYVQQWHLHTDFNHPDYDVRACSLCEESWNLPFAASV